MPSHWRVCSCLAEIYVYVRNDQSFCISWKVSWSDKTKHADFTKLDMHTVVIDIPNMLYSIKYDLNFNVVQQHTTMIKGCLWKNGLAFRFHKVHTFLDVARYGKILQNKNETWKESCSYCVHNGCKKENGLYK